MATWEKPNAVCTRWAGLAGTLGFPAIGNKAREIEELLRQSTPPESLHPQFEELAQRFSGALRMKGENGLTPQGVVALLGGQESGSGGVRAVGSRTHLARFGESRGHGPNPRIERH